VLTALEQGDSHQFVRYAIIGLSLDCSTLYSATILLAALRAGYEEIAEVIIGDIPANSQQFWKGDDRGASPLLIAAEHGFLQVVELLVSNGARLDVVDKFGRTALHLGAASLGIVSLLLQAPGRNITRELAQHDNAGNLPLHHALRGQGSAAAIHMLTLAFEHGGPDFATTLARGINLVGDRPAHLCRDAFVLRQLLRYGANLTVANSAGALPFHTVAALPGTAEHGALEFLAGFTSVDVRDSSGQTPLHYATGAGAAENARWLIANGADLETLDSLGEYPLMKALRNGHKRLIPIVSGGRASPPHMVVEVGDDALLKVLLQEGFEADVLLPGSLRSPIFIAAETGRLDIIETLLSWGADINRLDVSSCSVLAAAIRARQPLAAMLLIDAGASVHQRLYKSRTALQEAAAKGETGVMKALVDHGAEIDAVDVDGFTPLHVSSTADAADFLLRAGAKDTRTIDEGLLPLHNAALRGHAATLALFLMWRRGDSASRTMEGNTPLHLAVLGGHVDVVLLLLRWCASTSSQNNDGHFPAEYSLDLGVATALRDADVMDGRCQCDCGPYALGLAYRTSAWGVGCRALVSCLDDVHADFTEEVRCEPVMVSSTVPVATRATITTTRRVSWNMTDNTTTTTTLPWSTTTTWTGSMSATRANATGGTTTTWTGSMSATRATATGEWIPFESTLRCSLAKVSGSMRLNYAGAGVAVSLAMLVSALALGLAQ